MIPTAPGEGYGRGDLEMDRRLWRLARGSGMSRRRFLQLLAAGGAAAVLAACAGDVATVVEETGEAETRAWFKDPAPFIVRSGSLESRLENMRGLITPIRLFFVRNNSEGIDLDVSSWRLSIEGDAIGNPLELSYADLLNMPSTTLVSYLECAGNQRAMFGLVNGQQAEGTQWERGAVGNAEWTGVRMRDVLDLAGMTRDAESVLLVGLDENSPEGGFRRAMPVGKAMDPGTLLAYGMNGDTLPRDHGYPLRAVVPGWVGSSWIKWLGRIVVSSERHWTRNNTSSYVLIGDGNPPEGQAEGVVVTAQTVKSALALPWPAEIPSSWRRIHGYAHSPHGIAGVEWSTDTGSTWSDAEVNVPASPYSWARFEFAWSADPGEYTIMTRATDGAGNTQPDAVPFNRKGYLFNQPLPHPVTVV